MLALTAWLIPRDEAQQTRLITQMSAAMDDAPLEAFMLDDGGDEGSLDDTEVPLTPELSTAVVMAGTNPEMAVPDVPAIGGHGFGGWDASSIGSGGGSGSPAAPQAEFFGTVAYGDRFVYILDISGSMNDGATGPPREGCRFLRACKELIQSINELREDQWFYVLLFSDHTVRMFNETSRSPRMLPATPENKLKLQYWLATVSLGGHTDPREAILLSLRMYPSAVFLLSDGEFNGQKYGKRSMMFAGNPSVHQLVAAGGSGRIPVHTFAYEDRSGRANMQKLSNQTGGVYRYVSSILNAAAARKQLKDAQRRRRTRSQAARATGVNTPPTVARRRPTP
jgi:hypothetical protein